MSNQNSNQPTNAQSTNAQSTNAQPTNAQIELLDRYFETRRISGLDDDVIDPYYTPPPPLPPSNRKPRYVREPPNPFQNNPTYQMTNQYKERMNTQPGGRRRKKGSKKRHSKRRANSKRRGHSRRRRH